jgi:hypothetical protein
LLNFFAGANRYAISQISPLSLSLFFMSIIYALVAIFSLVSVWKLKAIGVNSNGYWLSFSLCSMHLVNVLLWTSYGMIGLRIWLL